MDPSLNSIPLISEPASRRFPVGARVHAPGWPEAGTVVEARRDQVRVAWDGDPDPPAPNLWWATVCLKDEA